MSDPIDDLKIMIAQSVSASDARAKDLADRMAARDNLDSEFRGEMRGAMKSLQSTQAEHSTRLGAVETSASEAHGSARKAMSSVSDLEKSSQEQWRSVMVGQEEIMKGLCAQNDDLERRERVKKDEREKESLANKRVQERRESRAKMATIWAPVVAVLFTTIVGAVVTITTQRAHEDTSAKIDRLTNLTTRNIVSPSSVTDQNYTAAPAAASQPPSVKVP